MCGIAGTFGQPPDPVRLAAMVRAQRHRGPDGERIHVDEDGRAGLGHTRLSIIDLSDAGLQPMSSADGRFWIVYNGEIYNYVELRAALADYPYRSRTDSEVVLAAYTRWGADCLRHFIGMFGFIIWDARERTAFAARDRFGVKPLYYCSRNDGQLLMASELAALRAAIGRLHPDPVAWATYLTHGLSDHTRRTFWNGIHALPPGHHLTWRQGEITVSPWYDLAAQAGPEPDTRPIDVVADEYRWLLADSVRLRFRSDVPVGLNVSGGLDSSTLLGAVRQVQGSDSDVTAFTFVTGDAHYDELPWVEEMLRRTRHPLIVCPLEAAEVPALARSVFAHQDEPFGGLPTLAYARVFERAREHGVIVLLDGQGMDEQWAGYDYYQAHVEDGAAFRVQGTHESPVRPDCLTPELRALAEPPDTADVVGRSMNRLRRLQYRDVRFTKLPKALRFNDRISMRASTELREPFLDHRLVELAFRQPDDRKIRGGTSKWLLRRVARDLLPAAVAEAPKRPLQTPQREWLRGPLRAWADECIEHALDTYGADWLDAAAVRRAWTAYHEGAGDNSFYIWQWISLGLAAMRHD